MSQTPFYPNSSQFYLKFQLGDNVPNIEKKIKTTENKNIDYM